VSRVSWNEVPTHSKSGASDDGRKHRPKHVQLTWNNKLIYIMHLVGYFRNCITMHGSMNVKVTDGRSDVCCHTRCLFFFVKCTQNYKVPRCVILLFLCLLLFLGPKCSEYLCSQSRSICSVSQLHTCVKNNMKSYSSVYFSDLSPIDAIRLCVPEWERAVPAFYVLRIALCI
jgi:hypothetical protein